MYCTSCGHELKDEDRFCSQCGAPVRRQEPRPVFPSTSGKRLVRPMAQKSIAGVCAGFANYLEMDITLMRIIWLCVAIFTGVGFIAYLVCWIVMPKDYSPVLAAAPAPEQPPETAATPPGSEPTTEAN